MSGQCHPLTKRQLFVFAATLLFCIGSSPSAFGQEPRFDSGSGYRPENPQTNAQRLASNRPVSRSKQAASNTPQPSPNTRADDKQQEIEQAIAQGNTARDKNDYEQALSHYQKVKGLNPKEARAFYGMGNVFSDIYCHDSAIEAYLNALELKKDYSEALIGLGWAYVSKERYDDALEQFRAALKFKSGNVEANIGLGFVYAKKGKYQQAIEQINLLINDKSIGDKDRANALVALGDVYWLQEKRPEAVAQFESAIRLNPNLARAYLELGNAQTAIAFSSLPSFFNIREVSTKELESFRASAKRAFDNLERAREHGYKHPNWHQYLGTVLVYQFRYQDAAAQFNLYFDEVKLLESRFSSKNATNTAKCDSGINRLNADGHWYLAYMYFIEGRFEAEDRQRNDLFNKAIEQLNQAVKWKQDSPQNYVLLGVVYDTQKNFEEALKQYQLALRYTTEESAKAGLYINAGQMYASLGRQEEALSSVQEAIRLKPSNPSVYEALATIYVTRGNLEETFKWLKKAEEVRTTASTNPQPYYYLGVTYLLRFMKQKSEEDFKDAVKWLKKAIEIRPNFTLAYQALGVAYEKHGDADEALASYKKAGEYDPQNPDFYSNMADVYFYLKGNDEAAIGLLKQAIGLRPNYAMVCWKLGLVYTHKKNYAEAIEQFLNAIKYDPKWLQTYLDLAYVYRLQKNYPEAIKYLITATQIAPTDSRPYQQMGIVYQERSSPDEALSNFKRAIEYDPKNAVNYLNVARVYFELIHDNEAAIKQLLKAIEVNPKYLQAYLDLASIYKDQKNYAEAIKYLTAAIGIDPTVPWTYKDLAKVYEAQGKNEDAVRYYEQALARLKDDDPSTKYLYLGRIARLKGQYAEAIEYFRKVSYPDEPGQQYFEIGVIYVVSKNKKAALEQHQQLVQLKSPLAEELLKRIKEMK